MNIIEQAKQILFCSDLDEKLAIIKFDSTFIKHESLEIPKAPARSDKHKFSSEKAKFPKRTSLHLDEKKAQALHFFANHELQAFEMMAAGLLFFPTVTEEDHQFKLGIMSTIQDEKKHFSLYRKRMNELGHDFGDYSIGDFFWKQMAKIKTKSEYYCFMALTLEAANLDFAKYYSEVFSSIDDLKTSSILNIVYDDEIRHVAIGRKWLNLWRKDKSLWQYYLENLPDLISPARAKGMVFDIEGRQKAGFDAAFINQVSNYRDDFKVTDRKNWK